MFSSQCRILCLRLRLSMIERVRSRLETDRRRSVHLESRRLVSLLSPRPILVAEKSLPFDELILALNSMRANRSTRWVGQLRDLYETYEKGPSIRPSAPSVLPR